MKIIDKDGRELKSPDMTRGRVTPDKVFVRHHEAVEAVEERWHYETVKEYPNGGKEVRRVIDVPGVKAQEAYDEYEDVLRYTEYAEEEMAEAAENRLTMADFDRRLARMEKILAEIAPELLEVNENG